MCDNNQIWQWKEERVTENTGKMRQVSGLDWKQLVVKLSFGAVETQHPHVAV